MKSSYPITPAIRQAMAAGGSRRTRAKLAALAELHAQRRGRRVHPKPAKAVIKALEKVVDGRYYPIAKELGVDRTTLRRWIQGIHWPSPERYARLRQWLGL